MAKIRAHWLTEGVVYIIHLDTPLHHARHYIGWTEDIWDRIQRHKDGRGSPYLFSALQQGIGWRVVRMCEGTKKIERMAKNRHGAAVWCPICTPDFSALGEKEMTVPDGLTAEPVCKAT